MTNLFFIAAIPGGASWVLIIVAVLLLFGGKKIPELMKGLGQGMKEFKKATKPDDEQPKEPEKLSE
ncbi:MAG: twin-arginine translocase TatA/TatE family subunit [Bacteroidales bacterium]|jgi:sec-independent protein translocase protein TatA|nr:twin-arginine translocase TatA/TatE family subunit [Bacteroidales bacterium]